MKWGEFPVGDLPTWCARYNVEFHAVRAAVTDSHGNELIAVTNIPDKTYHDLPTPSLLIIPKDTILSVQSVEQYANQDRIFRQLLDAIGYQVSMNPATVKLRSFL